MNSVSVKFRLFFFLFSLPFENSRPLNWNSLCFVFKKMEIFCLELWLHHCQRCIVSMQPHCAVLISKNVSSFSDFLFWLQIFTKTSFIYEENMRLENFEKWKKVSCQKRNKNVSQSNRTEFKEFSLFFKICRFSFRNLSRNKFNGRRQVSYTLLEGETAWFNHQCTGTFFPESNRHLKFFSLKSTLLWRIRRYFIKK